MRLDAKKKIAEDYIMEEVPLTERAPVKERTPIPSLPEKEVPSPHFH